MSRKTLQLLKEIKQTNEIFLPHQKTSLITAICQSVKPKRETECLSFIAANLLVCLIDRQEDTNLKRETFIKTTAVRHTKKQMKTFICKDRKAKLWRGKPIKKSMDSKTLFSRGQSYDYKMHSLKVLVNLRGHLKTTPPNRKHLLH